MSMLIDGQLDLLELLEPAAPTRLSNPVEDAPLTCPGCGHTSSTQWAARNDHWTHPADSSAFGYPVCIGMNLTRNHVIFWARVLSGDYVPPDKKCCHGAIAHHKGKITRAFELEHLREDMAKAATYWPNMDWLRRLLDEHDITLDEAGLDDDGWGANCDHKGCDWVTREAGYATRAAAMNAVDRHEKEDHT